MEIHVKKGDFVLYKSVVWSPLLASGYLKVEHFVLEDGRGAYELALTNKEIRLMFEEMVEEWFAEYTPAYNEFVKALLLGDLEAMNEYMNCVRKYGFAFEWKNVLIG